MISVITKRWPRVICFVSAQVYPFERWLASGTANAEPNNLWNAEHCGGILTDTGKWNDFECDRKMPFICELGKCC